MRLYKFRSLATYDDLERAEHIIKTGEFWCSRFWELNDPMEGVYLFAAGSLGTDTIRALYDEKSRFSICSFSGPEALKSPVMWGYYANGFKGIAIEVDVDVEARRGHSGIHAVDYKRDAVTIDPHEQAEEVAERILRTKLSCWSHEHEYRYLGNTEGGQRIGNITAVYYGSPYQTTVNAGLAQNRPRVRDYLRFLEALKPVAADKQVSCRRVDIVDGVVRVAESDLCEGGNA